MQHDAAGAAFNLGATLARFPTRSPSRLTLAAQVKRNVRLPKQQPRARRKHVQSSPTLKRRIQKRNKAILRTHQAREECPDITPYQPKTPHTEAEYCHFARASGARGARREHISSARNTAYRSARMPSVARQNCARNAPRIHLTSPKHREGITHSVNYSAREKPHKGAKIECSPRFGSLTTHCS